MDRNDPTLEGPVADALRALKRTAVVPPVDPVREAALLAAFDAEQRGSAAGERRASRWRRDYWYLAGFAAAAILVMAAAVPVAPAANDGRSPARASRTPARGYVQPGPPPEFVIVPGAANLPRLESGTLVRMDVPVSMLPSLGITPPPGQAKAVTADVIVAQDGLPRAVRLVAP